MHWAGSQGYFQPPTSSIVLAVLENLCLNGGRHGNLVGADTEKTTAIQHAFRGPILTDRRTVVQTNGHQYKHVTVKYSTQKSTSAEPYITRISTSDF